METDARRRSCKARHDCASCAPETSHALVNVDPSQLEQVMMNLVVNARDAASARTDTSPRATRRREPESVLLWSPITGAGMDAATREQVFEPFFTTKQQGSGLGLSTVYSIVQQAGGSISVESAEGQGATFSVATAHPMIRMQGRNDPTSNLSLFSLALAVSCLFAARRSAQFPANQPTRQPCWARTRSPTTTRARWFRTRRTWRSCRRASSAGRACTHEKARVPGRGTPSPRFPIPFLSPPPACAST